MCQGEALRPSNRSLVVGLWRSLVILVADNVAMSWYSDILEHTLVKVHVLQVDRKPENIAELTAGVAAGRTVERWQMPKGARPGDIVIWYASGRQQYIARGRVDAIPTVVREGPGPYRGPVAAMEWIEPVHRRKVIRECGFDGGVESYQTVDDRIVVDFLNSLGLSHLTPSLRLAQLCPTCYQVMPLTGVCDNCGLGNRFNCSAKFQDRRSVAAGASGSAWRLRPSPT